MYEAGCNLLTEYPTVFYTPIAVPDARNAFYVRGSQSSPCPRPRPRPRPIQSGFFVRCHLPPVPATPGRPKNYMR